MRDPITQTENISNHLKEICDDYSSYLKKKIENDPHFKKIQEIQLETALTLKSTQKEKEDIIISNLGEYFLYILDEKNLDFDDTWKNPFDPYQDTIQKFDPNQKTTVNLDEEFKIKEDSNLYKNCEKYYRVKDLGKTIEKYEAVVVDPNATAAKNSIEKQKIGAFKFKFEKYRSILEEKSNSFSQRFCDAIQGVLKFFLRDEKSNVFSFFKSSNQRSIDKLEQTIGLNKSR